MSTYFRDHVQEIKHHYPHPVEQFIVLSGEGHHDAANRLISDYAVKYRNGVNKVFSDFISGKKGGFSTEDEIQVGKKLCEEFSNIPCHLYTSPMTLEEAEEVSNRYISIINESIDAARDRYMGLRDQIASREYSTLPKNQQDRLVDGARALEDKITVLSLFLNTAEYLSPVNKKEPDAAAISISNGACMVM